MNKLDVRHAFRLRDYEPTWTRNSKGEEVPDAVRNWTPPVKWRRWTRDEQKLARYLRGY